MNHVSIYFHDEASYDCPDCKKPMDRAHIHGWFWHCLSCQKTWPLYELNKTAPVVDAVIAETPKKTLMDKIRGALHV